MQARARFAAPLLAVLVLTAACGHSSVPASTWAANVCSTLTPWRAKIANLNQQAQQQLAQASTPEQARTELIALLGGARDATENARAQLVAVGTPDVDRGDAVATRFQTALVQVRDAYAHALTAVTALAPADADFYDRVADVLSTLTAEYDRSGVDTSSLSSPDLVAAFAGQSKCR
jgi:hypothetical protein